MCFFSCALPVPLCGFLVCFPVCLLVYLLSVACFCMLLPAFVALTARTPALAGGLVGSSLSTSGFTGGRGRICLHYTSPIPCSGGIGFVVVVVISPMS